MYHPGPDLEKRIRQGRRHLAALGAYFRPLATTQCPACHGSDLALLESISISGRIDGRRAVFVSGCERCGLVFVNPMPGRDALDSLYSSAGTWAMTHEATDTKRDGPSATPHPRYVRHLLQPVRDVIDVTTPPAGSRVLDIGCGAGELLDVFASMGWETHGLDPADARAFPRHREVKALPETPTFQIVVLHHVLEHVDSPLEMLRRVNGALSPNGVVVISVPRLDMLPIHRDLHYCLSPRPHILAYTADCMATLLTMAGLDPVQVEPGATPSARSVRRLQMLGVKRASGIAVSRPLDAARRAFRGYARAAKQSRGEMLWPVRVRAALRELRRERKRPSRQ